MANIKFTAKEEEFVRSVNRMSGSVGQLAAKLSIDLRRSYRDAYSDQKYFREGLGKMANELQNTGRLLTYTVTAPLLALGAGALKTYGDIEALRLGLEAIEGSSEAAGESFTRIRELAKLPGLGFYEAAQGYTNLRSLGFGAQFAEQTISALGNALALGGKGKVEFSNVINQFTQMSSKSKVLMEDLKPILNAAPTIATAVKNLYGTISAEEISGILSSQGKSPADFVNDLVQALGQLPKAGTGVKNSLENMQDSLKMSAANLGEVIDRSAGAKEMINGFADAVLGASEWLQRLDPATQSLIIGLTGVAVASGPVLVGLGMLTSSVIPLLTTGFASLISPVTILTGSLVLAGTVIAQHALKMRQLESATRSLREVEEDAYKERDKQMIQVKSLVDIIKDENTEQERLKRAIEELQSISPEYFANLDAEKIKIDDLSKAVSAYADNIYKAAKYRQLDSQLSANLSMQQDILDNPEAALSWWEKWGSYLNGIAGYAQRAYTPVERLTSLMSAQNKIVAEMANLKLQGFGGSGATTSTTSGGSPTADLKQLEKHNNAIEAFARRRRQKMDKLAEMLQPDDIEILPINRSGNKKDDPITTLTDSYMISLEQNQDELLKALAQAKQERREAIIDSFNDNFTGIGADFIGDAFEGMFSGEGMQGAMKNMLMSLGGALQQVGKQFLVAEHAVKLMKETFGSGPWAALGAIAAGGVIKGLASNIQIPALAMGGMTTGPQLALIGDNPSGKEAVIPFERMGEFMNMARGADTGGYIAETRLDLNHLWIGLKRAQRTG